MPELSFLQADEGQRWLRCSLCGHDWRFDRMSCPGCAAKDARREIISIETSPHEWVELCPECRRYLVATDLRNSSAHIPEVAALGMLHLAALARERGYAPLAECAWGLDLPLDSRQPSGHEN